MVHCSVLLFSSRPETLFAGLIKGCETVAPPASTSAPLSSRLFPLGRAQGAPKYGLPGRVALGSPLGLTFPGAPSSPSPGLSTLSLTS